MWAETIRRDLVAGTASFISAGRKLIKAKQALEETNESFTHLVTVELGYDLDTAERWMTIARHPVLSDSATVADSLPTSWTTLYALSQIPPELLRQYIADGTVHPGLTYRAAVQLKNGSSDRSADADGGGDPGDDLGGDRRHGADFGPDSQGEIERKLARLEELEHETRRQAIQLAGYESEVQELKTKLGPETPIRSQRRLFLQALRTLQKSEVPGTLEKEQRALKQSAVTDFVELVRSAVRDGLKPERFDLFYRPELH
jgi:hypothetical protein